MAMIHLELRVKTKPFSQTREGFLSGLTTRVNIIGVPYVIIGSDGPRSYTAPNFDVSDQRDNISLLLTHTDCRSVVCFHTVSKRMRDVGRSCWSTNLLSTCH